MKTLNKYTSLSEHLLTDKYVQKYGMMLVKHAIKDGVKKVNPAVMFLDAALAVIEACNSYIEYVKEREITHQIKAQNELIQAQLSQKLMALQLDYQNMLEAGEARYKILQNAVTENRLLVSHMQSEINSLLKSAHTIQLMLRKEREEGISFKQIQILQKKLDEFIRTSIMCLMNAIEE